MIVGGRSISWHSPFKVSISEREREMGSKSQEYKELFEKIDQEEDGEVYLRYKTVHIYSVHKKLPKSSTLIVN